MCKRIPLPPQDPPFKGGWGENPSDKLGILGVRIRCNQDTDGLLGTHVNLPSRGSNEPRSEPRKETWLCNGKQSYSIPQFRVG